MVMPVPAMLQVNTELIVGFEPAVLTDDHLARHRSLWKV